MRATGTKKGASHRLIVIALIGIVCAMCAALLFSAGNWMALAKAKKLKNPIEPGASTLAEGKRIYSQHCENCHGERGDGKGQKAAELSTAPTDFTDPQKMSGLTDGELFLQITKGRQPMPAFEEKLTPDERWESVDFLRTFASKPAADSSSAPAPQQ